MQRAAIEPADYERTLAAERTVDVLGRQALAARSDGEPRPARVLSLNGEEALGHLDRAASRRSGKQLGGEAL